MGESSQHGHRKLVRELDLLPSNSEVRRMIKNGGIRINQEKIIDPLTTIDIIDEMVVQVGKRKFVKLRVKEWIGRGDLLLRISYSSNPEDKISS